MIKAIVCIDENFGIGYNNKLLISIPEDMQFFKEKTLNNIVVMGKNTLFSFKNKSPLKNRINIVFTTDKNLKNNYLNFDNIFFIQNFNEIKNFQNIYKNKEVFLIGGETIYKNYIDKCDEIYITKIHKIFSNVDSYFPNITDLGFTIKEKSEIKNYNNINYEFITYIKG